MQNRRLRKTLLVTYAVAVSVALATSSPPLARASVSIAIPFDDLVRDSTAAAVVTPESESSVWEDGRIITYTEVHVDALVAGSLGGAAEVWVRTRGGDVGHIGQAVEGEAVLTVGRPTLLFLRPPNDEAPTPYVVTARAQGQFPIVLDEHGALRLHASFGTGHLVPKALAADGAPHPLASAVLHGQTVSDAEGAVARAWDRLHAR